MNAQPSGERGACLNCGGSMVGKTRKAKFCGRECQVDHLRSEGPVQPAADPMTAPKNLLLQLDADDRDRLTRLATHYGYSARRTAHLIMVDRLNSLCILLDGRSIVHPSRAELRRSVWAPSSEDKS